MTRRSSLLAFVFLFSSTVSFAQSNCPEGFRDAGTLSGTGSHTTDLDERVTLMLPENARLDESYQQQNVRATNGKRGVRSSLRAQDVPKGILIIPHGKSDELYNQGWAVSNPELKVLQKDESSKVTRYEFGMKLSCHVAGGPNPIIGDCSVDVEVCYKPLK
jgi:hypothetical protein